MQVEVISPQKIVYKGEAEMAEFPGENGKFQVLENHAPLMSTLSKGEVLLTSGAKVSERFSIVGGYVEVKGNKIIVLINQA